MISYWFECIHFKETMKRNTALVKIFTLLKIITKVIFYILFVVGSYSSVEKFIKGTVLYDITPSEADSLKFPEVILCPRQEGSLAYLKTTQLREDNNLTHADVFEHSILIQIQFIPNALRRYGFTFQESIHTSKIM